MAKIQVIFKPVYEMIMSLNVLADKSLAKYSKEGPELARAVKKNLAQSALKHWVGNPQQKDISYLCLMLVLAHEEPIETIDDFMKWFNSLNIEQLLSYYSFSPSLVKDFMPHLKNIPETCSLLAEWDREYFSKIDPQIIGLLEGSAGYMQQLAKELPAVEVVERATDGIRLEDIGMKNKIVLIPQYHARPFNSFDSYPEVFVCHYPVDTIPSSSDPSPQLLRLTSALADENRLKIMQFLNQGEKTFMNIVKFSGLAKSTVHHHMLVLRAAGLVRAHVRDCCVISYSVRTSMLEKVSSALSEFINSQSGLQ